MQLNAIVFKMFPTLRHNNNVKTKVKRRKKSLGQGQLFNEALTDASMDLSKKMGYKTPPNNL